MTVAEMIAELRARGKKLTDIGRRCQVAPITVQRWAHGEYDPRYQQGKALEGLYRSVISEARDSEGVPDFRNPMEQHTTVVSQVSLDNGNEKEENVRDENKDTP